MEDTTTPAGATANLRGAGAPDSSAQRVGSPDEWAAAFAALRERVDRLETDVRQLQSQLSNRA